MEERNKPAEMASTDKRPACLNYEFPCRDCVQPIRFTDVPDQYLLGEKISLKYSVLKTYSPKSGDWVGLFRCHGENGNAFEFVTFAWAQKRPSYRNMPQERVVHFNLQDFDMISSEDEYVFLYLTLQERIIGQSRRFRFKLYMEIKSGRADQSRKGAKVRGGEEEPEPEPEPEAVESLRQKPSDLERGTIIKVVESLGPGEFPVLQSATLTIAEETADVASIGQVEPDQQTAQIVHPAERTATPNDAKEKQETQQEEGKELKLENLSDILDRKFDDLSMKNVFLKARVSRIEDLAGNILTLQKALQDQMLQCMTVVETCWNFGNKDAKKQDTIQPHRRYDPKRLKNLDHYFRDLDQTSLFSGSSQTFRALFSEEPQSAAVSQKQIGPDRNNDKDKDKDDEVKEPARDITVKRALTDVDDLVRSEASDPVGDTKKSRSLPHGKNDAADVPVRLQTSDVRDKLKSKSPDAAGARARRDGTGRQPLLENKSTQTSSAVSMAGGAEDGAYMIKIKLREAGNSPRILLREASQGSDDDDDEQKQKKKKGKAVILDVFQESGREAPKATDPAVRRRNSNVATAVAADDDDDDSDRRRAKRERLLASSSYPSSVIAPESPDYNDRKPSTTERKQKEEEQQERQEEQEEREGNSSASIVPSADVSMAVQVGSMEQANPQLVPSPAATRLAMLDSYEMLASNQRNVFARSISARRCNSAKLTLLRAILESNLTDEEKVSSIGLLLLGEKRPAERSRSLTKQFPGHQAAVAVAVSPRRQFEVSTEYENSDTSAEAGARADNESDQATGGGSGSRGRMAFQGKNRRSKKLRRNRFGRNKSTQTDSNGQSGASEHSLDSEPSELTAPRPVKKPLLCPVVPLLKSDSRNSFGASSDDDFKAKPILKKKKSPPVQAAQSVRDGGGQSPKRSSVTFLLDASTQCDGSAFYSSSSDAAAAAIPDPRVSDPDQSPEFSLPAPPLPPPPPSSWRRSDELQTADSPSAQQQMESRRERKVSFNTIILTSLIDGDETDRDESGGRATLRPNGGRKSDARPSAEYRVSDAPPIHQFLDAIETEARLMAQCMANIQRTVGNAIRVFKTEAITLKDKSAEMLNRAIKSLAMLPGDSASANIDDKPIANQSTVTAKRTAEARNAVLGPTPPPFTKNSPAGVQETKPKPGKKPVQSDRSAEKKPASARKGGCRPLADSDANRSSATTDGGRPETSVLMQRLMQEINGEILARSQRRESSKAREPAPVPTRASPSRELETDSGRCLKDVDSASSVGQQSRPESLLSGPADMRDFWEYNFGLRAGKKTYSTMPQASVENSRAASLSFPSVDFPDLPSLDNQSLMTSCFSANPQQQQHQQQQRSPGLMLVRSFDSTISNIVSLYNTFTSYAYGTDGSHRVTFKAPRREMHVNSMPLFISDAPADADASKAFESADEAPTDQREPRRLEITTEDLRPFLVANRNIRHCPSPLDFDKIDDSTSFEEVKVVNGAAPDDAVGTPPEAEKSKPETVELRPEGAPFDLPLEKPTARGTAEDTTDQPPDAVYQSHSDEFPRLTSLEPSQPQATQPAEKSSHNQGRARKNQQKKRKKKED